MLKLNLHPWTHLPNVSGKELAGVELGATSVKIVKIATSLNKIELLDAWSANTSGSTDEEIAKMIGSKFAEFNLRSARVINIIPTGLVITKNIEIPSTNPLEIKDIIALQAGRHTPYSREEIIVDYLDIGVYKNNYSKILLVIVARNVVKRQVEILEKAGLRFDDSFLAAEGIACASARLLKVETQNAPAAIVHIDESSTDFLVVFKGKPLFIRSLPLGAAHLSEDSQTYEGKFIEEVKRSIEGYQNEDIEKLPLTLVLCGVLSDSKGVENALGQTLHFTIKSTAYLTHVAVSGYALKQVTSFGRVSFFDVLSPLVCQDKIKVNLIPEEIRLRKAFQERGRDLIKTGISVLTIGVLIFSVFLTHIYAKSAILKKLDKKFQAIHDDARELEASFTKINLIKEYLSKRGYSLEVLGELYAIMKDDILLSDIRFDVQGRFSVKGTAEVMSSVFSFVEQMGKSKYFKDVKTRYTTKRKEGLKDVTDFEIQSVLVKTD
ncbi:MAG: pilus assembly protein PilM [Candidatus Omnitrophota bacterium]